MSSVRRPLARLTDSQVNSMSRYDGSKRNGSSPDDNKSKGTNGMLHVSNGSGFWKGASRIRRTERSPPQNSGPSSFYDENEIIYVNGEPYMKLKLIGRGGSSLVYKVLSADAQVYALKQVSIKDSEPCVLEAFTNEIMYLNNFRGDEMIIQLIDSEIDQTNQLISMVLELGDVDLLTVIRPEDRNSGSKFEDEPQCPPNFIRLIWEQMLRAVQKVHEKKILHADLKPANFLFVDGNLKLIDFGIATKVNVVGDTTSVERQRIGTLNYMSPEALGATSQDPNSSKVGRSTDVWSLGCILYQLVYGRCPFDCGNYIRTINAIVNEEYQVEYPKISTPDGNLIVDVVKQCLRRNPKERPTISQLLQHPYLTNAPECVERDVVSFITFVQDELLYQKNSFLRNPRSARAKEFFEEVEEKLLEGEPLDLAAE